MSVRIWVSIGALLGCVAVAAGSHHTGSVYLNGRWLTEAADKATVLAPAGASPLWYAKVEGGGYLFNVAWLRPVTDPGRIGAPDYSSRHGMIASPPARGRLPQLQLMAACQESSAEAEGVSYGPSSTR